MDKSGVTWSLAPPSVTTCLAICRCLLLLFRCCFLARFFFVFFVQIRSSPKGWMTSIVERFRTWPPRQWKTKQCIVQAIWKQLDVAVAVFVLSELWRFVVALCEYSVVFGADTRKQNKKPGTNMESWFGTLRGIRGWLQLSGRSPSANRLLSWVALWFGAHRL